MSRQVADRIDTGSSSLAHPSQRIIGLFPELLGVGGIQEAGRQTVVALDEIARLRAGEGSVLSRRGRSGPG